MATLAFNKRANFDYEISDKYEAGLVLSGPEVKSVKMGHISLKESFVTIRGSELFLTNAHITPYKQAGGVKNYDPTQPRKLLMHRSEIKHLTGKVRIQGLTLVPIRVYTRKRLLKLEFGLGKGKKKFDKRADISKREVERNIKRELKSKI
ncbi:MAG: SsrA-binding protein SmpB [Candidatus Moranbacteria bacterium]|nr:SsrA-binding protein SmpB [Candidatus Moranbacteria bacterium]MDZ4385138.1 SsrA-binding protein SmpB [Candidatus Moranbacteria bacterium]